MYRGTVIRLSLAAGLLLTLALGFACSGGGGGGVVAPIACGNGLVDTGEQCDNGAANSDVVADACRTSCLLPTCGDSVQDTGEQCDDGNTINGDGCEACVVVAVACGNGVLDAGEQCDDGAANSDVVADACRTTCLLPTCGDSVQDTGEQCDDGNTINGDGCEACVLVSIMATFTPGNPTPGSSTINMTAGAVSNDLFDVQIRVKDIDDFYGAAFRVSYDPLTAEFVGETQPPNFTSPNDSFIFGFGFGLDFRAVLSAPGEVLVVATRQGQIPGVPASLNNELLTSLTFRVLGPTTGNSFAFGLPREVQTCSTATDPCTMVNDATLTWSGGIMTTN